ncbi:hypothetical protein FB451DRAFT_1161999 [Mycena latifolia]|nr:hypothetical protein FB451DRAFT_1161999 [Mycena latifolia]
MNPLTSATPQTTARQDVDLRQWWSKLRGTVVSHGRLGRLHVSDGADKGILGRQRGWRRRATPWKKPWYTNKGDIWVGSNGIPMGSGADKGQAGSRRLHVLTKEWAPRGQLRSASRGEYEALDYARRGHYPGECTAVKGTRMSVARDFEEKLQGKWTVKSGVLVGTTAQPQFRRNRVKCGPPEELDARNRCRMKGKTKFRSKEWLPQALQARPQVQQGCPQVQLRSTIEESARICNTSCALEWAQAVAISRRNEGGGHEWRRVRTRAWVRMGAEDESAGVDESCCIGPSSSSGASVGCGCSHSCGEGSSCKRAAVGEVSICGFLILPNRVIGLVLWMQWREGTHSACTALTPTKTMSASHCMPTKATCECHSNLTKEVQ